jgi:hypothetical protein
VGRRLASRLRSRSRYVVVAPSRSPTCSTTGCCSRGCRRAGSARTRAGCSVDSSSPGSGRGRCDAAACRSHGIARLLRSGRPRGAVAMIRCAVRAQRHLGLVLEPSDDVDGVAAHEGRVRPVERSLQRGRDHRGRRAPRLGDPWVVHLGVLRARGQHPGEHPIGFGPEDHPLLLAVSREATVEQLGALLAQ